MKAFLLFIAFSVSLKAYAQQQIYPSLFTSTYTVDSVASPDYYKVYVTITSYWTKAGKTKRAKLQEVTLDSMHKKLIYILKQNNITADSLKLSYVDNGNTNNYAYNPKIYETYSFLVTTKEDVLKAGKYLNTEGVTKISAQPKLTVSQSAIKNALLKKAYNIAEQRANEYSKEKNILLGKIYSVNEMFYLQENALNQYYNAANQKVYLNLEPVTVTLNLMISYEIK